MKLYTRIASSLVLVALMITIMPGATSTASAATCYWAQFISDVTVPDGTNFAPNTAFNKTWRLKNIGSCAWNANDVSLIFDSGERMGASSSLSLPTTVNPGQTVDITVSMTAPSNAGHYFGYYKFRSASGGVFGIGSTANNTFWVEINVNSSSTGTGYYDFTANAASATWTSGAGSLSFPGTDGSSNGFAFRLDNPRFENGVSSSQPGLLFMPNNVTNGYIQGSYPAFRVNSGDRFQATIGCEYGATNCYTAYRLDYQIGSGSVRTFWTFRERYEGLTYNVNLDLSSLAGQDVRFILVISAYGSPTGDRALWGYPVISRVGGSLPPPPPAGYKYDFGTSSSPLASGYSRVYEATAYSAGGFGWTDTSGLESRDRSALADDLKRDFVMHASAARTFKVDLPNGGYSVSVTMGDNDFAHDNMVVKANGATVLSDVDSGVGGFTANSFNVTVSGGSLTIEFSDGGGSDTTWVVNTLSITSTSAPPPPANCDRAQFISDVTVPDGTNFNPNVSFSKTWRLKNVGTCTWTNYSLMFDSGEKMGGPDSALIPTSVAPGQTVDITITLTSPSIANTYRGYWKLKNNNGIPFGIGSAGTKSFWVEIRVTSTAIISVTPGTPVTPATSVPGTGYDFYANVCAASWYSGAGQLPCPGTDGDAKGFVLIKTAPLLENNVTDSRPGLLTNPQNVTNGYIQGIYPTYRVKPGDKFRSTVSCEGGATSCYVVFRLDYSIAGSSTIQTFWAFVERYEGMFYSADIDLTPLTGQDVKFILTVLATGSPAGDRALWVAPIIYNAVSGGTPTFTPTPTRTPTVTGTVTVSATPTVTTTATATSTVTPTATIPAAVYKYDFGTATSPLAAGFTRITEMSVYTAGTAGWVDASGLESRDRGAPADDLTRDLLTHGSAARTFKVDLPNGTYSISITMGDNDYSHDNMIVKANGATVLADVDNTAGAFTTNTFVVGVSGGSLSLEFSDAGGADPSWVVNSLTITTPPP